MAQKRMLDKNISISEDIADLTDKAKIIFTWSIPHTDDLGLLPFSLRTLKAMIVPMDDMGLEEFKKFIKEIGDKKLYSVFEHKSDKFLRVTKFLKYQTLKKDRPPQTLLKLPLFKTPKEAWNYVESLGFQLETIGNQMEPEEKGSEENLREGKIPFEFFWKLYPKKVAKKKAEQKWERLPKETQELILADLPKRVKCDQWLKGFILDPTTYLNGERWLDEIVKGPEPKFGSPQVVPPPDPEEVAYQARKAAAIKACGKCDKGYVKVPGTNTMAVCECIRKLK